MQGVVALSIFQFSLYLFTSNYSIDYNEKIKN